MDSIDKIVLGRNRQYCTVHMVSGATLKFNFMLIGMTYFEGIKWLEDVFGGNKQSAA